ncbi:hypothetical protein DXN05_08995 [Deminuibacter soli]|uniref:Uncharacterized protein n=1 Tax=Deminuibacter soli TaxID=2291815 RepID=A0A3E1NLU9_9BACT|nr:hypothetical protein DXN05_08995 [Deminuibacter soli]
MVSDLGGYRSGIGTSTVEMIIANALFGAEIVAGEDTGQQRTGSGIMGELYKKRPPFVRLHGRHITKTYCKN